MSETAQTSCRSAKCLCSWSDTHVSQGTQRNLQQVKLFLPAALLAAPVHQGYNMHHKAHWWRCLWRCWLLWQGLQ